MTKKQKLALIELVKTNEQFKGYRVVIDYAISLACIDNPDLDKEMTDFVQKLYGK